MVAGGPFRLITQMHVHLGVQQALGQRLLQLASQTVKSSALRAPRSLINRSRSSRSIPSSYFLRAMRLSLAGPIVRLANTKFPTGPNQPVR